MTPTADIQTTIVLVHGAWAHPSSWREVSPFIHRAGLPVVAVQGEFTPFTSNAFTGLLRRHGIRISMDGKGCWRDKLFIERVWRSIKYEEVYLHAYETVSAARAGST